MKLNTFMVLIIVLVLYFLFVYYESSYIFPEIGFLDARNGPANNGHKPKYPGVKEDARRLCLAYRSLTTDLVNLSFADKINYIKKSGSFGENSRHWEGYLNHLMIEADEKYKEGVENFPKIMRNAVFSKIIIDIANKIEEDFLDEQ
jgi:hypothetical protein